MDTSLYLPSFNNATHPSDKVSEPIKHIFVVDSRQRDCLVYPNQNNYNIQVPDVYRNVTSIELKAAMLPRTEYNINNINKYLDISIGDYISEIKYKKIKITNENNEISVGIHNLKIASPHFSWGTQCQIQVEIDSNYNISNYTILNPGSGYSSSNPPNISLYDYKQFDVKIGVDYISMLREGQYTIGGNPTFINNINGNMYQSWTPSNLVNEIESAISNSILNDSEYCYSRKSWSTLNKTATEPEIENFKKDYPLLFTTRIMSQYPTIDTYKGLNNSSQNYNTNCCHFNRIYLSNSLILKTSTSPTLNQLNGTSTFKDSLNFEYSIIKHTKINGSNNYILYCKLENPLKKNAGNYWTGLSEGDMNGDFEAKLAHWEIKFASGRNYVVNSASILGFNKINYYNNININTINVENCTLIPSSLSYSAENDYNLLSDPDYTMLSFRPKYGGNTLDGINSRVDSAENSNVDGVFACLLFDAVNTTCLQGLSSGNSISNVNSILNENNNQKTNIIDNNGISLLTGAVGTHNSSFLRTPGLLKASKGTDFDQKIYIFPQPVAQIWEMNIRFTKFSRGAIGSEEELYNFAGREHLLIFEITCADPLTGRRS